MNDVECDQTFGELSEIVRSFNLDWIIEQVKEEIRAGENIDEETVRGFASDDRDVRSLAFDPAGEYLKAGRRAKFPVVREYSACERVILLIEAVDRAVVETAQMEAELLARFAKEDQQILKLGFADDEQERIRLIDTESVFKRAAAASELNILLKQLKDEVSAG
jgi:hypothetical protein